jgi:Glycosyl transferase family 2
MPDATPDAMDPATPLTRPAAVVAIIAAKDEAARIASTVAAVRLIDGVDLVVVVDDGSTDGTARLAGEAGALVIRHRRNRGKAAAMATGARAASDLDRRDPPQSGRAESGSAESGRGESESAPSVGAWSGSAPTAGVTPGSASPAGVRDLLFIDADLEESAANMAVLVAPVTSGQADMTIAVLPPQETSGGGHGFVVRLARGGIERRAGWSPTQPLSGMRCLSREAFDAASPLARGWGVEVGLTIDVLGAGLRVLEVPCDLRHRVTGSDWKGQVHRARQYRDVWLALAARRVRATPLVRRVRATPLVRRVRETPIAQRVRVGRAAGRVRAPDGTTERH